jgi:hypothetical protein
MSTQASAIDGKWRAAASAKTFATVDPEAGGVGQGERSRCEGGGRRDRGSEQGFPFEKDFARVNAGYYNAATTRIDKIVDGGQAPCIVGMRPGSAPASPARHCVPYSLCSTEK